MQLFPIEMPSTEHPVPPSIAPAKRRYPIVDMRKFTNVLAMSNVENSTAWSERHRPISASAFSLRALIRARCAPESENSTVSDPEKNAERANRKGSAAMATM